MKNHVLRRPARLMQARPARTWPARARHPRLTVAVAALELPVEDPFAGGHSDFAYHGYSLASGSHDLFSLRQRTALDLYRGERIGLLGYYHTHLMVGPVQPGEEAFSAAEWYMNALQFEYAHTSQHSPRGGYLEISSDTLEATIVGQVDVGRGANLDVGARLVYIDLSRISGRARSSHRASPADWSSRQRRPGRPAPRSSCSSCTAPGTRSR